MSAPVAPRRPHRHEKHGDVRIDDYYWLRERDNAEVREYLEAENAHVRDAMAGTAAFEERLFEEIKGRIKQTDMSVPYREDRYRYYRRYEEGREYEIHCRRPIPDSGNPQAPADGEQVILDVNQVAAGHAFSARWRRARSVPADICSPMPSIRSGGGSTPSACAISPPERTCRT